MHWFELFLIAIALSMDAFAVSLAKGLARKTKRLDAFYAGAWFGSFQMAMPLLGYFFGKYFLDFVKAFDHWIAFGLLSLIGCNMIRESFEKEPAKNESSDFSAKIMFPLAIATSIDALAAGVSFGFLEIQIFAVTLFIGGTTFLLSFAGVLLGKKFSSAKVPFAMRLGGIILILLGVKILIEHLFFSN